MVALQPSSRSYFQGVAILGYGAFTSFLPGVAALQASISTGRPLVAIRVSGMGELRTGQRKPGSTSQTAGASWAKSRNFSQSVAVKPFGGSMSRLTVMFSILGIVGLPLTLGGCAGALLVALAGAAGGGYAAAQERGVDGAVSDLQIETNLESAFAAADPGLNEGITTTVYQGRVLLAGTVATPQMKASAVEIASRVSGIKGLYDNVELAPARATWDAGRDAWITARIRSELMLDPDIRSGNYTIDTQKGSVYLIGSARSQAELERATRIAQYIPGVKRVVSYVELRPGAPVAEQPIPAAHAGSNPSRQSPQGS